MSFNKAQIIFLTINKGVVGGAELYFRTLVKDFSKSSNFNIRLLEIGAKSIFDVIAIFKLAFIRRHIFLNSSVLGTQFFYLCILILLGNKVILLPHIVVDHRVLGSKFPKIRNLFGYLSLKMVAAVVAISEGNRKVISELVDEQKIIPIYNYSPHENNEAVSIKRNLSIAMVGRIHEKQKSPIETLNFIRDFLVEKNLVIHFFGGGPDEVELKKCIKDRGLSAHAVIHGWRPSDDIYLQDFFCVINNSNWEGLSLAVMESIYNNKVVLASDIPGNLGVVSEDFLFSTREELIKRLEFVLDLDIDLLNAMCTKQKILLFSKCSKNAAMKKMEALFELKFGQWSV